MEQAGLLLNALLGDALGNLLDGQVAGNKGNAELIGKEHQQRTVFEVGAVARYNWSLHEHVVEPLLQVFLGALQCLVGGFG